MTVEDRRWRTATRKRRMRRYPRGETCRWRMQDGGSRKCSMLARIAEITCAPARKSAENGVRRRAAGAAIIPGDS